MSADTNVKPTSLYEQDYQIWLDDTASCLKSRNFDALDLENLIEEIESLGRSDKRSLKSYLLRLCEHFFKLCYWEADRDRCFRGWDLEITNFRIRVSTILEDSPSLRRYLDDNFLSQYKQARRIFLKASTLEDTTIPERPWFTLEQVLDPDWLPWQPDSDPLDD
ncbi:DUF29 domain-containing protein [Nodosilinea sp. PGN35]|uniref:DUF29 domain-containing protein n=1 Tax=Nodosilinea sp. PGN35 TaxID=3020489 RepID=UPI0023B286F3|nr:DUF29 domain-containing protein [Nodosilinea sp. TSF1-S3]MDF0370104.1 DUF29 domain-containing protein [Nodosilinea sp. TSF1-S3]